MSNEREELANYLAAAYGDLEVRTPDIRAAESILAAGYRKPRVIEDAYSDDGPDSLQPLSVVLSGGKPAIRQYDHTFMDYDGSSWDDWEMEYPMTVLHEPEVSK